MSNIVSVIIVSWNKTRFLENCLASILAIPPASVFESWVVENASAEDSPRMLREKFSQVHLTENLENVGVAPANNHVIQQCTGKYILLLNPDTLVAPDALQSLVDFLDKQPEAGTAGARILISNGFLKISSHLQPTLTREFWRLLHLADLLPFAAYAGTLRDIRALLSSSKALCIGGPLLAFNPGTS